MKGEKYYASQWSDCNLILAWKVLLRIFLYYLVLLLVIAIINNQYFSYFFDGLYFYHSLAITDLSTITLLSISSSLFCLPPIFGKTVQTMAYFDRLAIFVNSLLIFLLFPALSKDLSLLKIPSLSCPSPSSTDS